MKEHCVKVYLKSSGTPEEVEAIHELCETLEDAIEAHEAGDFDGDEFGGGECTLYMYGPNADRLFEAIRKPLVESPLARGGYVIERYGPPEDGVREFRIDL